MNDRLLKISEVCNKVSFSRDTIYKMMSRDEFPKQIKVGKRSVRWKESVIDKWIDQAEENSPQIN